MNIIYSRMDNSNIYKKNRHGTVHVISRLLLSDVVLQRFRRL